MINKQEVIEKIEKLKGLNIKEKNLILDIEMIPKGDVLEIIEQLDEPVRPPEPKPLEPEKPVVPQFVADFYESIKDDFEVGVFELCVKLYNCDLSGEIRHWFDCDDTDPIQTLVNMHQFGYEVKKDKLYTAELMSTGEYLHYDIEADKIHHFFAYGNTAKNSKYYHFTKSTLIQYNAWGNDAYDVNEVEE